MSKKNFIALILIINFFISINCFVFPNNNIENLIKDKNYISRAYNLTSISQLNSFINQKKHIFMYFFADFCSGCKELLTFFNKASSYEFVYNSSNILLVDCNKYKDICFNFNLETLPFLKIYYMHSGYNNYSLINYTFYSYEFNDVISLIQKVTNSGNENKYKGLSKLRTQKDINKFSNTLGDVSFVLMLDKKNITKFYFGYSYNIKNINKNLNIKYPLIYMTGINYNDFNLNLEVDSCDDIINFIKTNEFPIFKNFDNKYLFKLLKLKKTIFIFNIDKKQLSALPKLIYTIQKILIQRRDLIFGYLDINEDKSMLSFFRINSEIIDKMIIVYDFKYGKYVLRRFDDEESLKELISDFDNNKLIWKSGYFLEDFLSNTLGINVNRNYLITFFMLIFSVIFISFCIFCFQTFEKIDKKLK